MSHNCSEEEKLMFKPYSSILNPGFWQQLTTIKLNKLKLSKEPVEIHGSYACNLSETLPCLASFDHSSFSDQHVSNNKSTCTLFGKITCTNIMQEFLDCNKKEFLETQGQDMWRSIIDGRALIEPEKYLSRFGLLVYADLKKYKFFYWFSFPAINYPKDVYRVSHENRIHSTTGDALSTSSMEVDEPILNYFSENALQVLQREYDKDDSTRSFQRGYFIVKHFIRSSTGLDEVLVFPLTEYEKATSQHEDEKDCDVYFAYSDPSADQAYPGWPLRNFLCLIAVKFRINTVKVIRIRKGQTTTRSKTELQHSSVLRLTYVRDEATTNQETTSMPLVTGWEKNESQQLAPKRVNLSSLLDPKKLAEDAVNLNLRLMKWRLLPGLNLDKIAETKCLLLGCGTLGCHIARGLLAWGIKNISIVDNARISYSNPVRQTLYSFDDCSKSGSTFKAEAAAINLRRIHPTVNVNPYVFSIPMPGHHVVDKEVEQTKKDVILLENLIGDHDAIFLLTDTRESRWLPTVIAMSKQKLVINAAIGFDTFLLQRFGIRDYKLSTDETSLSSSAQTTQSSDSKSDDAHPTNESNAKHNPQVPSDQLGCYFCNDIVAPGDSTLDRTLDQQCTVSRPGVSMMVSAMAVELLASIVCSKLGPLTPAPLEIQNDLSSTSEEDCGSELGIVPHSIRGNLARYHVYMPTSSSFNKCSACSPAVVNSYRKFGYEFLQRAFNDPNYLEEIAGLKDLQNINDNVWALDSDDDLEDLENMLIR